MNRTILLQAVCAASLFGQAPQWQGIQKVEVKDGIYQFIAPFDGDVTATSTAIVNDNDVVVVDTTDRPSMARAILAEMRKVTDKPVRFVINTHSHPDHWSGNEVYAQEFPGVQFISTADAREIMKVVAPVWPSSFAISQKKDEAAFDAQVKSGKNPDGTPFTEEQRRRAEEVLRLSNSLTDEIAHVHRIYPSITFGDRLTLHFGQREYRLINCFGDATGEAVVYLPQEKVLLTGDVLTYPRSYMPNGNRIVPWIESLKMLDSLDVDVTIPGHGPALHDKAYLRLTLDLLQSVVKQVRAALEQGLVTVDEVQKTVKLDAFTAKFARLDSGPDFPRRFQNAMNTLIRKVYIEARDGREFTR